MVNQQRPIQNREETRRADVDGQALPKDMQQQKSSQTSGKSPAFLVSLLNVLGSVKKWFVSIGKTISQWATSTSKAISLWMISFWTKMKEKVKEAKKTENQTIQKEKPVTATRELRTEKQTVSEEIPEQKTVVVPTANKPPVEKQAPTEETEESFFWKRKSDSAIGATILGIAKTFTYLACVFVAGVALAIAIVLVGNDVFGLVKEDRSVSVTIPENATIAQVGEILYENGCISFPKIFYYYCNLRHEKGNFLAGEYTVSTAWDYDDYRYEFKEKEPEGTIRLMIPEGSTTDEIINIFVSNGIGTYEGFVKEINEGEFDYWFVKDLDKNGWSSSRYYRLDGYLFPDTYDFYLASSEWGVINKMLRRFRDIYTEAMKSKAKDLGMTTDQVVILASMVEKEAYYASDLSLISSVFHNRLTNSFLFPCLQSDATIAYAMQHDTGVRPSDDEINVNYVSPYNTYLFRGLPPGAIANPGYAALAAALYPSRTSYYYFVSYPSGYTLYGSTLQDHNNNIQQIADAIAGKEE